MNLHRASVYRHWLAVVASGLALLHGTRGFAATTNANPAPESLLARLPDPSQWKKSPLEDVAKGTDPIVNDPTFKDMVRAALRRDAKGTLNDLRTLTQRYPNQYAFLHELRGKVALNLHFVGEAEDSFRRATAVSPQSARAWYNLSWIEVYQNRLPAATADLHTCVKASDSYAPGWILLAGCQERQGKIADATASAIRATQVAPNYVQPWIVLAHCELKQNKPDAALSNLDHARSMEPNNVFVNASIGYCYVQTNRPAKAIEPYQTALRGAPKDAFICRQLGYCYLANGQAQAGETVCRQGVKAQPKYGPAWDMLGLCYQREGKQREAVDAFQHAVNDAPHDLNARAHLDDARLGTAPSHA